MRWTAIEWASEWASEWMNEWTNIVTDVYLVMNDLNINYKNNIKITLKYKLPSYEYGQNISGLEVPRNKTITDRYRYKT